MATDMCAAFSIFYQDRKNNFVQILLNFCIYFQLAQYCFVDESCAELQDWEMADQSLSQLASQVSMASQVHRDRGELWPGVVYYIYMKHKNTITQPSPSLRTK